MEQTTLNHVKGGSFLLEETDPYNVFTPEDFSEQHQMISKTTSDFVDNEILPRINDIDDQKDGLTVSLLKKAGEVGLLSIDVPEEYGGLELGITSSILVAEHIGRTGSWAVSHGAHTGIGTLPIVFFGTEDQKKKYLPRFATGEWISSYSLSEPSSGSDALSARTTAVLSPDNNHYLLNGTKMWLSNAGFADVYITFAQVNGEKFSAFIIEKGFPGVSTGAEEKKMGIKGSSTRQLILENAQVPVENLLGEIGRGHIIAFNILNIGRFKLGAAAIGAAKKVIADSNSYAKTRMQFNKPIADFGMIKHKLAEMAIRTFVGESMLYRTAGLIDTVLKNINKESPNAAAQTLKGIEEYAIECSILKVYCSEILDYVVDEGVQIFGGYGYSEEYPVARAYRDSRINRIFEGTNEINRLLIPAMLLKRSRKGELDLLRRATQLANDLLSVSSTNCEANAIFSTQRKLIDNAKKLAVMMTGIVAQKFLERLSEQQEILSNISDIVMDVYAMESVLLRVEKNLARETANEIHIKIVKTFVNDTMVRVEMNARDILSSTTEGDTLRTYLAVLKRFTKYTPLNTVALRRVIADELIGKEKYSL
ncbi:MAG: acyl-CoA dehydrogenase family protein [Ignavibacteria bacterium]|nr:acyl-CoA dehydrogenase family protein [Ignavibacteria bacterium]